MRAGGVLPLNEGPAKTQARGAGLVGRLFRIMTGPPRLLP
jgi:hypothetical protein